MLVLGILLLIVGGAVAYFGRARAPRADLLYYAGIIIFLIGVVLLVIWVIDAADANTSTNAALFGPVAWVMRKIASRLDGQQTMVIPPGQLRSSGAGRRRRARRSGSRRIRR
jgi:hypothetical protein